MAGRLRKLLVGTPRCPRCDRALSGGSCLRCANIAKGHAKQARRGGNTVAPYTCRCGRRVSNPQGICPGPDC